MADEVKTSTDRRLDPKWVQMCEGVRNNDQTALEELFRLLKRISWPRDQSSGPKA